MDHPMDPTTVKAMLDFIDRADMLAALADGHRPHVLVVTIDGEVACAVGPFPDLYAATAYAPHLLDDEEDPPADWSPSIVTAHPLLDPAKN